MRLGRLNTEKGRKTERKGWDILQKKKKREEEDETDEREGNKMNESSERKESRIDDKENENDCEKDKGAERIERKQK